MQLGDTQVEWCSHSKSFISLVRHKVQTIRSPRLVQLLEELAVRNPRPCSSSPSMRLLSSWPRDGCPSFKSSLWGPRREEREGQRGKGLCQLSLSLFVRKAITLLEATSAGFWPPRTDRSRPYGHHGAKAAWAGSTSSGTIPLRKRWTGNGTGGGAESAQD